MANLLSSLLVELVPKSDKLLSSLSDVSKKSQQTAKNIETSLGTSLLDSAKNADILKQSINKTFDAATQKAKAVADDVGGIGKESQKSSGEVENLGSALLRLAKPLAAIFGMQALSNLVTSTTEKIDKLGKTADFLGLDVGELDAWQEAAMRAGGSAEGLTGTIESLSSAAQEVSIKGKSRLTPYFKSLGISLVDSQKKARPALDLLRDLSRVFEKTSKAEAVGIGKKIGLDQGTIKLLQMGSTNLDALIAKQKALGVTSLETARDSATFNDNLADIAQIARSIKEAVVGFIIKPLNALFTLVAENSTLFKVGVGLIATALLAYFTPAILTATAAAYAFIAPIALAVLPFIALAAAIAFIVDDIIAFNKGYDSLVGRILTNNPRLAEAFVYLREIIFKTIDFIVSAFQNLISFLKNPKAAFASLSKYISIKIDEILAKFPTLTNGVKSLIGVFDTLKSAVSRIWDFIVSKITGGVDAIKGAIGGIVNGVGSAVNAISGLFDKASGGITATSGALAGVAGNIAGVSTTSPIINNSQASQRNVFNVGGINVNTAATSPDGISSAMTNSLRGEISGIAGQFASGRQN
jgi:hypothetical protein